MCGFTDVVSEEEKNEIEDILILEDLIREKTFEVLEDLDIEDPIKDMKLMSDGMLDEKDLIYIILEVEEELDIKIDVKTNTESKLLMEYITLREFLKILYRNVKEN